MFGVFSWRSFPHGYHVTKWLQFKLLMICIAKENFKYEILLKICMNDGIPLETSVVSF